VKILPTAKLFGATVAVCIASFSGLLFAQSQHSQLDSPQLVETAALALPDAPVPQTGSQTAAPAAADGQTTPSSSSSQQSAPAPGTAQPPAAGATPATAPAAAPPSAAELKRQQHDEAERELKVQEKQRLLGVMPQFQVVMGGTAVPLTGGEKWKLALHTAIDPFYIGWAFVIGGGYGELSGSHSGYGWGAAGYFKRVGATYADNVNGALIGNALLPQLLHQDPRYYRKGTGPVFKRFLYAAESTVVCRGDNGKTQANFSNVLGNYISGGISNLYYPADERGIGLTLENGTSVTLFGALGGQVLEFGPDLARMVHHKPKTALPATAPVAPAAAPAVTPAPAPAKS
jgi:hypothetical protein